MLSIRDTGSDQEFVKLTNRDGRDPFALIAWFLAILGLQVSMLQTSVAEAAGIERTLPSTTRILFEEGTYAEIGVSYTDPHQRGTGATLPSALTGFPANIDLDGETSDLFEPYWGFSAALKTDLTDRLSFALVVDEPYGADTSYGSDNFGGAFTYTGTIAELDARQITGVMAYDLRPDLKLYGGVRALWTEAKADVPFLLDYKVTTDPEWGAGYLLGVAWSRPELAMRVALTYASEIKIRYATEEWETFDSTTEVRFPQAVDLEFQTGVSPRTLLFGSVRWVEWSAFQMAPKQYTQTFMQPLVNYEKDFFTYTVGIGRQLTESLSGSLSFVFEPSQGGSSLNTLGPYDGRRLGAAALNYEFDRFNLTGGLAYGRLGDTSNGFDTQFDAGRVLSGGLRLGYTF
ncbi:MAG: outer membrane protein transport protein [Pseudomonadota bacterium]